MNEGMLSVEGSEWSTFFLSVTWFLWKNCNAFIFQNVSSSRHELIASTLAWTKAYGCRDKLNHWACYTQTTKGWQLPDLRWVKVNVDGSVSTNGKWLTGFAMVTGMAEVFQVEARAVVEGLKLAWMKGYKQVQINYDNALLIDTIRNGFASISNIREVQLIHEWCHKDWKIKFRHILHESNKVADCLAKAKIGS
ncbi:hypothetical protein Gotri_026389 [Gossypium trilobum]|uniref:RNase H type-1 domain-containing protein n=1 Tax=Gossypium trilobum TaxID=34281 RepID=A0A7J9FMN7_9ROSI|nr:hypothetical protein [Gossypium trilobum]